MKTMYLPRNSIGLFLGCLMFLLVGQAKANTYVWTGAGGDNKWSNANNWSTGTVPVNDPNGTTIQISGTNTTTVFDINAGLQIAKLQLTGTGIKVLGNGVAQLTFVPHGGPVIANDSGSNTIGGSTGITELLINFVISSKYEVTIAANSSLLIQAAVNALGHDLVLTGADKNSSTVQINGRNTVFSTTSLENCTLKIDLPIGGSGDVALGDVSLGSPSTTDSKPSVLQLLNSNVLDDLVSVHVYKGSTLDVNGFTDTIDHVDVEGSMIVGRGGNFSLTGDVSIVETTGTIFVGPLADLPTDPTPPTSILTENNGLNVFGKVILGTPLTPAVLNVVGQLDVAGGQVLETKGAKATRDFVKMVSGYVKGETVAGGGSAGVIRCTIDLLAGLRIFTVPSTNPAGTPDFELHGQIIDSTGTNGSGTGGVDKQGTGTMLMESTVANLYTGSTTVELGTLQILNTGTPKAPGAGTAVLGAVSIGSGGTASLQYMGDYLIAKDTNLTMAASGQLDLNGFTDVFNTLAATSGAINLRGNGSLSFGQDNLDCSFGGTILGEGRLIKQGSGKFTFTGSSITGASSTAPGTLVIEKGSALLASSRPNGGAPMTLQIGTGSGAQDSVFVRLSQANQLPDNGTVIVKSDGWLDTNNFADKTGTLQIQGGDVTQGNADLEVATELNFTGGDVSGVGNLILSGKVVVNAASSTAYIDTPINLNHVVTFDVSATGHQPALNITDTVADGTLVPTGFLKTGLGDILISGGATGNTYSGTTTVSQGRLILSHTSSIVIPGNLVIGNATDAPGSATVVSNYAGQMNPVKQLTLNASGVFDLQGRDTTFGSLSGTGGTVILGSNDFTVGDSNNTVFAGNITGTGHLIKVGLGQLALAGVNDLYGNTTVQNGTLLVNGSLLNSAVTVSAGAVFGGTGSAKTVDATGSTLRPGSPLGGALQTSGNVLLNNGNFASDIDDSKPQKNNQVVVNGNLDLSGATLTLSVKGTGTPTNAYYLLASYGSLTGNFQSVTPLPSGYNVIYNFDNGSNQRNIALYKPVLTLPATNISGGEATFHGIVTLSGNATKAYFEYKAGASGAYVATQNPLIPPANSTASIPINFRQTGLLTDQIYFYRMVLETTGGNLYGTDQTFSTTAAPMVQTKDATNAKNTTVTLNGTVFPANQKAYYIFQYGNTTNYELTPFVALPPLVGGSNSVEVSKNLTGLTGGRTYNYRIVGSLSSSLSIPTDGSPATVYFGENKTFVTPGPVVQTLPVTHLSALSAEANGSVNPAGKSTTVYFEYGLKVGSTVTYNLTTTRNTYTGNTVITLPATLLKGLKFNADYAYRIVATNSDGISKGDPIAFHTLPVVKPNITTQPTSKFVAAGTSITLTTVVTETIPTDSVPTYQWRKNLVAVPGATSASYVIPVVALTHAGAYDCVIKNAASTTAANTATTNTVQVGVVDTTETKLNLAVGVTASMKANNAGSGLSFAWSQANRTALSTTHWTFRSTSNILATNVGQKLVAGNSPSGDTDTYTCTVSSSFVPMQTLQVKFKLQVFNQAPVITTSSLPDGVVSAVYNGTGFQIAVDPDPKKAPASYATTGLPTGLSVNPSTGLITGKPTVSSPFDGTTYTPFKVTLKASNSFGDSTTLPLNLIIKPLPTKVVGTFNGLVARNASLGGNFGGKINVTITTTGTFSGNLGLGAETVALTGKLDGSLTSSTVTNLQAKRVPATLPPFIINLAFDGATGEMTGTVTDGVVTPALAINGWVNPYSTASPAPLAATYTAVMDMANSSFVGTDTTTTPPGNPANVIYPQGNGFTTVTVTPTGTVTWVGKMADGSAPLSYSTTIGPGGQIPVHFMLYTNTGAAHGMITATADSVMPVNNGLPMLDGTISWNKDPQASTSKDLVYKAGIPLHDLTLVGGKYVAPTSQVLGLATARLVFTEGGLKTPLTGPSQIPGAASMAGDLNLLVSLSSTNVATMPTTNPAAVTLTVTGKTGAISGAFTLKGDQDPTVMTTSLLTRSVKYNGLIISRKSINKGVGYFLLSQLPSGSGATKTTVLTSQQLSGQMVLETP